MSPLIAAGAIEGQGDSVSHLFQLAGREADHEPVIISDLSDSAKFTSGSMAHGALARPSHLEDG